MKFWIAVLAIACAVTAAACGDANPLSPTPTAKPANADIVVWGS